MGLAGLIFRHRPKVITVSCCRCGTRMRVIEDSVPDQERLCNPCVFRETRRAEAPTVFLPELHRPRGLS